MCWSVICCADLLRIAFNFINEVFSFLSNIYIYIYIYIFNYFYF
ncbi:MAG: hypothetical protein N7Q72_05595 [Spiroplasma sp. Tabriz.8]|nr:hypothetical protein [Spiroplasma sp. Tabriz.8]